MLHIVALGVGFGFLRKHADLIGGACEFAEGEVAGKVLNFLFGGSSNDDTIQYEIYFFSAPPITA